MIVAKEQLSEIKGVHTEWCGQLGFNIEEVDQFCDQWLYEQESVEIDDDTVADLVENCELTEVEAIRQAVVDAAYTAWLDSLDYEPSGAGSVSIAAIV